MKTQKHTVKQIIGYLIVPLFLISCGQGSNLEMLGKAKSTPKKTSTGTSTGDGTILGSELQDSTNTNGNTTSSQSTTKTQAQIDADKAAEAACSANRTKLMNLNSCAVILKEYSSYDSNLSKCYAAMPNFTKTSCTDAKASLTTFGTGCSGVIASSSIMGTLQSENRTCYDAIQALK